MSNNVPTTNTNRLGNRNGTRIFLVLCLSHVVERREEVEMNHIEVKVEFEKCEWSRESDDVWRSDCGLLWEFDNEETPKANNMNYCPQCGKILKEAPEYWEEDEDE